MSNPLGVFNFEVLLDLDDALPGLSSPLCNGAFAECDGLELTMQPTTVEVGGMNDAQQHLIGKVSGGQLVLRRGLTSDLQLWTWFERGTKPGSVVTAHGRVTVMTATGEPALSFSLEGCLPVRIKAPSLQARGDQVAVEELALVYRRLQAGGPGGLSATASFGASASVSLSAGLSVSGGGAVSVGAVASGSFGGV